MGHGTTIQLHCIGTWYNAVVYILSSTLGHGPHCLSWPGLGTWTLDNGLYGTCSKHCWADTVKCNECHAPAQLSAAAAGQIQGNG